MSMLSDCPIRYKALIFDCDGVLVDSEPLHCRTWREVFLSHGVDLSEKFIMRFVGMSSPQTMRILTQEERLFECDDHEAWICEKRDLFWRYVEDRLEKIAGVDHFLKLMKGRAALAMATGSPKETYTRVLRRMKWNHLFQVLVGADDVQNPKPHPDIYLTALQRLGLEARECLVFEDSLPGVEAARAAGLEVVGIASSQPPKALLQKGAKAVLKDFTDEIGLCRLMSANGKCG